MSYLALDWGVRKVGMAIADDETRIAFVAGTETNDADLVRRLAARATRDDVSTILVGVPSHAAHGNTGAAARTLCADLAGALPDVTIVPIDEMFTTTMAQSARRDAGKSGGDDDAEAARIMLQEWLDAQSVYKGA